MIWQSINEDHFRWNHHEWPSENWKCDSMENLGGKVPQIKRAANKNSLHWKKKNLGLFKELKEAYYEMKENEQG